MKNILISGYAAHELGIHSQKHKAVKYIRKVCIKKMIELIENGTEWFISAGQYGFDLWATEIAIKLRDTQYPHIAISVIHAYANQTGNWNETKQQYWSKIQHQLDHYDIVSKQEYNGPWQLQARDNLLLMKSNGMLLFYDQESAESKVKYIADKARAKSEKQEYGIIQITADDIQQIIEEEQEQNY